MTISSWCAPSQVCTHSPQMCVCVKALRLWAFVIDLLEFLIYFMKDLTQQCPGSPQGSHCGWPPTRQMPCLLSCLSSCPLMILGAIDLVYIIIYRAGNWVPLVSADFCSKSMWFQRAFNHPWFFFGGGAGCCWPTPGCIQRLLPAVCVGVTPGSAWGNMWCQVSNQGRAHLWQMPSSPCFLSSHSYSLTWTISCFSLT